MYLASTISGGLPCGEQLGAFVMMMVDLELRRIWGLTWISGVVIRKCYSFAGLRSVHGQVDLAQPDIPRIGLLAGLNCYKQSEYYRVCRLYGKRRRLHVSRQSAGQGGSKMEGSSPCRMPLPLQQPNPPPTKYLQSQVAPSPASFCVKNGLRYFRRWQRCGGETLELLFSRLFSFAASLSQQQQKATGP